MTSLAWKLNRLRLMGASEILYRVRNVLHAQLERRGLGLARPCPPQGQAGQAWVDRLPTGFDRTRYVTAADRILDGRFDVFALENAELGFPPDWNRDCRTGTVAPMDFGKTLDYRDERKVGDIKYLWEPSRHLELVTLAQAWHLTRDVRYAEGCRTLLDSWMTQCPYPLGVHWTSSLEHSVRLMNWYFAWHLLGGEKSPLFDGEAGAAFRRRWLDSIYCHCHFIAGHFSKHSSANNHLLGEYMGLLVGALNWPCWRESATWQATALAGFEAEALKQNSPDGVNREQAIYYQHEVMDMMLLCAAIAEAHGRHFSEAFHQRLASLADFISSVMNVSGVVPMVGDSDDAVMVRLSREADWNPYRSLLATCGIRYRRADFAHAAGRMDDKTRWLLGDRAESLLSELVAGPAPAPTMPKAFREGGYFVLGSDRGTACEALALIDCGPLGYLSIAAHGHADALALYLSLGGDEVLIDPGTFAYHTQRVWRDYFRGTAAHNTVRIDGADQSEIGGSFMWMGKARASLIDVGSRDDGRQFFVGEHDGYLKLPNPALHRRRVEFDPRAGRFEVIDEIVGDGSHEVELFWHFAEGCAVSAIDGRLEWRTVRTQGVMRLDRSDFKLDLTTGQESPPSGWISRRFDRREPIATARFHGRTQGTVRVVTTIEYSFSS